MILAEEFRSPSKVLPSKDCGSGDSESGTSWSEVSRAATMSTAEDEDHSADPSHARDESGASSSAGAPGSRPPPGGGVASTSPGVAGTSPSSGVSAFGRPQQDDEVPGSSGLVPQQDLSDPSVYGSESDEGEPGHESDEGADGSDGFMKLPMSTSESDALSSVSEVEKLNSPARPGYGGGFLFHGRS